MRSPSRSLPVLLLALLPALVAFGCGGKSDDATPAGTARSDAPPEVPHALARIPPELVGLWEESHRGQGGQGLYLRLGADGSATRGTAAMIDFKYEYDGKRVRAVDLTMNPGQTFDVETEIDGDEMVQLRPDMKRGETGSEIRKGCVERLPGADEGIVGIWEHETQAGMGYERYGPDGRMQERVPVTTASGGGEGTFELEPGHLILMVGNGPAEHFDYEVKGDTLTLSVNGKPVQEFARAEYGDWYLRKPRKPDYR